jgi:3-isopropylmalate dehydrogenase
LEWIVFSCFKLVVGSPFPDETRELIDEPSTCAVFLGAVGGPEWPPDASVRPEQGSNI